MRTQCDRGAGPGGTSESRVCSESGLRGLERGPNGYWLVTRAKPSEDATETDVVTSMRPDSIGAAYV